MKVKGTVIELTNVESVQTAKGEWKKQSVVVEYQDGDYTKKLAVEFLNQKIDKLKNVRVGDTVEIDYNIDSRKGKNGIWYTSASGWRINTSQQAQQQVADNSDDLPY